MEKKIKTTRKIRDIVIFSIVIYIISTITILFFVNIWKSGNVDSGIYNPPKGYNTQSNVNLLDDINSWVGIILGLVATIFSIISMWITFYTLEKSHKDALENQVRLTNLQGRIIEKVDAHHDRQIQEFHEINKGVAKLDESIKSNNSFNMNTKTEELTDSYEHTEKN